ncbi:aldose 1-epimerase family protein [Colletotrichum truncatum]|uniref:Aldose 1-epimerase family protein n=1 Tax=Colletotrichum truncatum TaxID=5467 RepID=A0ACC3YSY8_COLTU|nr:aldose 1-epimerase family protein [Colletotrichum truncatum]KAF6785116.1 aldose 1-epimerase family protein [Colletotrichum truncatum]
MVDRPNKPTALATTPGLPPQATVSITHSNSRVSATLPTGESVEVLLHGATVLSWKDASGRERLWMSEATVFDGSKPVRGGIPLVFPVFGPPSDAHPPTAKLSQHGFARSSRWEFLGKSTSEGSDTSSVKLDFGLSSANLDEETKAKWGYKFGAIYSVTLDRENLSTSIVVTNEGEEPFDCQILMHTYLRVNDITQVQVQGLDGANYTDKVHSGASKTQSGNITIDAETDRIYTPPAGPKAPVTVLEAGEPIYSVVRDNLENVVVWNPWVDKANSIADFAPKDGYKHMLCVEPGSVKGWQKLEGGDAFEGAQIITAH